MRKINIVIGIVIGIGIQIYGLLKAEYVMAVVPVESLRNYVTNIPANPSRNQLDQELISLLETQVTQAISTTFTPLRQYLGRPDSPYGQIHIYFNDPVDLFYTLSISLPYLNETLKQNVITFLANEHTRIATLNSGLGFLGTYVYPLTSGVAREQYLIGPDETAHANASSSDQHRSARPLVDKLYQVWAYANYSGNWSIVDNNWTTITNAALTINPNDSATLLVVNSYQGQSINRKVASLIGYARMAQHRGVDKQTQAAWGGLNAIDAAATALSKRIQWEVDNRPTSGNCGWHCCCDITSGGKYVIKSGSSTTHIPRLRDLVPEIGSALKDFESEYLNADYSVAKQAEYLETTRPAGHQTWGPKVFEGETFTPPLSHTLSLFQFRAYVQKLTGQDLKNYLDQAASIADYYYLERLVRTVEVSATGSSPSPSPSPSCPQGDVTGDCMVNLQDAARVFVAWIGTGSPTEDINKDGKVNSLDFGMVLRDW